jgi:hypothetical protein
VHAKGIDLEDDRLAMSLTDAFRCGYVNRQMNLLPLLWLKSLYQDRLHESRCGSVIEHRWRLSSQQTKLY